MDSNPNKPRQVNLVFTPEQYARFKRRADKLDTTVTAMLWERCYALLEEEEK